MVLHVISFRTFQESDAEKSDQDLVVDVANEVRDLKESIICITNFSANIYVHFIFIYNHDDYISFLLYKQLIFIIDYFARKIFLHLFNII